MAITHNEAFGPDGKLKPGYAECEHCHGFGSSLHDPEGVDVCTKCGGSGIVAAKPAAATP